LFRKSVSIEPKVRQIPLKKQNAEHFVRQAAGLQHKSAAFMYTGTAVFRNIQAALSSERISMRLSCRAACNKDGIFLLVCCHEDFPREAFFVPSASPDGFFLLRRPDFRGA
jgi:hypothetical protein